MHRPGTTEEPNSDAAYPRYFVKQLGFADDTVFLRVDKPDGEMVSVHRSGRERCDWPVMAFAHPEDWREITASDAGTLLATQTNRDGDRYQPAVRLGQGDYVYEWPPRPTAQPATIDVDKRPGISDDPFPLFVGMGYMFIIIAVVLAVLTKCGVLTWHWST